MRPTRLPPRLAVVARTRTWVGAPARPARLYSTPSSSSPSSKICAAPFRLPPDQALTRLQATALLASASFGNGLFAVLLRFFGATGQWLGEQLNLGKNLELKAFKAVYYPTWRCDVILQGRARAEQAADPDQDIQGWIGCEEVYVPGNAFAPLSYLSLAVDSLPNNLPVYDPKEDLAQLGDDIDVVPVPFTASPFGLVKHIRRTLGNKVRWDGVTIFADEWEEKMLACYPVMFPMYIAEYKLEFRPGDLREFPVFIEAHHPDIDTCRVSFPPLAELAARSPQLRSNYFVNPAPFMPQAHFLLPMQLSKGKAPDGHNKFINIESYRIPGGGALSQIYSTWMSPAPTSESHIPPSPMEDVEEIEKGTVEWDDPRIQSWSGPEREENREYLSSLLSLKAVEGARRGFEDRKPPDAGEGTVMIIGPSARGRGMFEKVSFKEMMSKIGDDEAKARQLVEATKPKWLKKWEAAKRTVEKGLGKR